MPRSATPAQRAGWEKARATREAKRAASAAPPSPAPEAVDAFKPLVADATQAMSMTPPTADFHNRVAQLAAADFKPDDHPREQSDVSRLLAMKIAAAYRELGLEPPHDTASMESHITFAQGSPVINPEGEVDAEADAARVAALERKTLEQLAAPNSKRALYLAAMRQSPPMRYYNPTERDPLIINGVNMYVPEGWVEAKKRPDDIGVGCVLIAQECAAYTQARQVEQVENRRMREIVMHGKDEDMDRARPRRPATGAVW